ncbi:MAG TPA: dipeptide epimerase [Phycisphaerae bacterium]|nr:dipeptide epimerase [Phycisphaerae bacterium]
MNLSWTHIRIIPASPFKTAKAVRTEKQTLWVRIEHAGVTGWGEAVPMDTYGQTLESAESALRTITELLRERDPHAIEEIIALLTGRFDGELATVSAIDAALHDWIGKRYEIPTVRWLGLESPHTALTSFTIGIDTPEIIAAKVRAADAFPILKVKVGTPEGDAALKVIREIAPRKTVRVDANQGWTVEQALENLPRLKDLGVEFVEQPVAAGDLDGLRRLKQANILPIIADESCVRPADVVRLAGCVDGINIKLGKCGGIREAIKMIHLARGLGMKVMLGCMIESSLGIAAAAQLASLADWLDLDGYLLIREDPFMGLGGAAGRLSIGGGPGLGVLPSSANP